MSKVDDFSKSFLLLFTIFGVIIIDMSMMLLYVLNWLLWIFKLRFFCAVQSGLGFLGREPCVLCSLHCVLCCFFFWVRFKPKNQKSKPIQINLYKIGRVGLNLEKTKKFRFRSEKSIKIELSQWYVYSLENKVSIGILLAHIYIWFLNKVQLLWCVYVFLFKKKKMCPEKKCK